jgi:hypothetical protein
MATTIDSALKHSYDQVWARYRLWKEASEPVVREYITALVRAHEPYADRLLLEVTDQGGEGLVLRDVLLSEDGGGGKALDIDDLLDDDELTTALLDLGGIFEVVGEQWGEMEYDLID